MSGYSLCNNYGLPPMVMAPITTIETAPTHLADAAESEFEQRGPLHARARHVVQHLQKGGWYCQWLGVGTAS